MQASNRCINAIKQWEGCRLQPYSDLNGFKTVGYGHKLTGAEIQSGEFAGGIARVQADELLGSDVAQFEVRINSLSLSLTQGQFDAAVSFAYNLGIGNLRVMLGHGLAEAPVQIQRWVHAGGQVQPGLVERRTIESQWWRE